MLNLEFLTLNDGSDYQLIGNSLKRYFRAKIWVGMEVCECELLLVRSLKLVTLYSEPETVWANFIES